MPYYKICSNPECDFSNQLNQDELEYLSDIDTNGDPSAALVATTEFLDRCCVKCKSHMHLYCPHCKRSLFERPDLVFCSLCGRRVKSE
jgi:hypothetical protein